MRRPLPSRTAALLLVVGLAWANPEFCDAQVRPGVVVIQAEAGLFGPPATSAGQFLPSTVLPLRDGQEFGWRATLKTNKKAVRVLEELALPSEPRTWGDPEPDVKRKTSVDGRTATSEYWLEPADGIISNRWTVTTGDPKGTWTLRVRIEDQADRVFRFTAR